jgi:Arc/MetJ-type ribon-helix-helix transcriptional regulator
VLRFTKLQGKHLVPTVQISDEVKDSIDRHVAAGSAPNDVAFVEEAIRLYAEYLEDGEDELIAAAQEGIEAMRRGDYTTISSPEDAAALFKRIRVESLEIAAELRASRAADASATEAGSE